MRKLICGLLSLVTIYALAVPASADSSAASCQEMIGQARGAYYNLKRQGFRGFKATIEPNWDVILGPTSTPESLKVFRSIRFFMVADANGAVTVTHQIADTEKARSEAYARQIHENLQRLVAGFFGIWTMFMVSSPFPESDTSFKIDNAGKECRLFFTTESTDIVLAITNDLLITEWKLSSPGAKRTIKPLFQKTSEGLLLKGYHSVFEPVGEDIRTELEFTIQYQDVDGLKLPHTVELQGLHGSEPVTAELRFSQYVLNPRQARR
jgi:hypothetical protein